VDREQDQPEMSNRALSRRSPGRSSPLLDAVELHGAHDFRHTFSNWLEDADIQPASLMS
jgi:hypothetical protein